MVLDHLIIDKIHYILFDIHLVNPIEHIYNYEYIIIYVFVEKCAFAEDKS